MGPKNGHSNGRHTTRSPSSLAHGKSSDRDNGGVNHAPFSSSPRRRPRGSTPPRTAIPTDSSQKNEGPSYAGIKNKRRRVFLVCVSGLAWAFLIVRVLGPAVSPIAGSSRTSLFDGEAHFQGSLVCNSHTPTYLNRSMMPASPYSYHQYKYC